MKLKSFFQKDPDLFEGSFEPILVEAESESKKHTIVLGLVKERDALYFVVRKRFPTWDEDVNLDSMRVSVAVRRLLQTGNLPHPTSKEELLRMAFELFVKESLFCQYIRDNLNVWATGQFFQQLRAVAPDIITSQLRRQHEQGSGENAVQCVGRESG